MQITVGKWKTRGGQIVEITKTATFKEEVSTDAQPLIDGFINGFEDSWYADGRYFTHSQNELDLIEPVIEIEQAVKMPSMILVDDPRPAVEEQPEKESPPKEMLANRLNQIKRAHIAREAMKGLITFPYEWARSPKVLADMCYDIADAMIAKGKE